ncbi:related to General alpha-glucoside permease [Melanopsichium pennsylvanicum]|uniref:Related to General alpha-glucoside permease n=1 Tax=Melanopsichium pennsylvanicum TaxID=63383 RepID=A0AAJ5C4M3_9BASI|nr:related to General alpha-glucoside permease [Melanopsichium pennsylvanicum]
MSSRSSSTSLTSRSEHGTGSQSKLRSALQNVRIQTPEAPASLEDLLNSPHNPSLHQPGSTLKGASAHDPRRRSGFHLWRTESEDARNVRLRRAIESAQAQTSVPGTLTDRFRIKLHYIAEWISSHHVFSLYRHSSIHLAQDSQVDLQAFDLRQPKLTRLGLIILTLSLAGAQLAWTLELAYGTPYLLSLGLSEQSTSLVWLAGPLSGLIAQPVVGSLSDHSTSSFRRRKYMIISAALLTLSTITLAYSVPISTTLVDLFGGGLADWDPHRHELVHSTTQAISVIAFWILDFALNGLQAASRALILDTAASEQQSIANAWQGRMTHAGNVLGYLCGWVDLASWKGLRWLGTGQFRRFAIISLLAMISCVSITVGLIQEAPIDRLGLQHHHHQQQQQGRGCASMGRKVKQTVDDVWHAVRTLPRSVRRVCLVQLFAFMGWFPFLFYGTTYVLQIAQYERNLKRQLKHDGNGGGGEQGWLYSEPMGFGDEHDGAGSSSDSDAEKGSFAMLMFALVSLVSAALLPYLALAGEGKKRDQGHKSSSIRNASESDPPTPTLFLDTSLADESGPNQHQHHHHHGAVDMEQNEKLSRAKRIVRGLTAGLTLRTFWTIASVAFATIMLVGTAWASTVYQATVVIALVGVPWSVAAWAPFAMVGEFVREAEQGTSPFEFEEDHWSPQRTRERIRTRSEAGGMGINRGSATKNGIGGEGGRSSLKFGSTVGNRRMSNGEQGTRERIQASLVNCSPLPHTLTHQSTQDENVSDEVVDSCHLSRSENAAGGREYRYGTSWNDDEEERSFNTTSGGAGTILGIHNLAIVAPQFLIAIIASLIFSAVHSSRNRIHLVLGQHPFISSSSTTTTTTTTTTAEAVAAVVLMLVGGDQNHHDDDVGRGGGGGGGNLNPAEATIWVLRFGGTMALFAALCTRFVPLTLSERNTRYAQGNHAQSPLFEQHHYCDEDEYRPTIHF